MKTEPSFDQIPIRMMQLGLDRPWLAEQCDYSPSHVASILAPNGDAKAKTKKALRRMWEALDREEDRRQNALRVPPALAQRVMLEPSDAQFDRWMAAAYRVPGRTFDAWARAGLDRLAAAEFPALMVAEEAAPYGSEALPADQQAAALEGLEVPDWNASGRPWTPEEDAMLGALTDFEVAVRARRDLHAVTARRIARGIIPTRP